MEIKDEKDENKVPIFQYEVDVKTFIKVWDNQQRFTIVREFKTEQFNSIRRIHVRLASDCKKYLEIKHR